MRLYVGVASMIIAIDAMKTRPEMATPQAVIVITVLIPLVLLQKPEWSNESKFLWEL